MPGPTHFRVTILTRSQGRNAVEAAAYRSGSKLRADTVHVWSDRAAPPGLEALRAEASDALAQLKDMPADDKERRKALALVIRKAAYQSGTAQADKKGRMTFDYSDKEGVLHAEILAPRNSPEWVHDRGRLWNELEACEKRKNAQLARDLVIALPRTTTHEQNLHFVRGYLQKTFVREGMVADFAIHESMASDGKPNPHVHVLLTMREIGKGGFNSKKATPRARAWNDPKNVAKWREAWMQEGNAFLEELGLEERIEMRSYAARGIDKQGTKHLGAEADRLEKQGKKTRAGDANREIQNDNKRREGEARKPSLREGAEIIRQLLDEHNRFGTVDAETHAPAPVMSERPMTMRMVAGVLMDARRDNHVMADDKKPPELSPEAQRAALEAAANLYAHGTYRDADASGQEDKGMGWQVATMGRPRDDAGSGLGLSKGGKSVKDVRDYQEAQGAAGAAYQKTPDARPPAVNEDMQRMKAYDYAPTQSLSDSVLPEKLDNGKGKSNNQKGKDVKQQREGQNEQDSPDR